MMGELTGPKMRRMCLLLAALVRSRTINALLLNRSSFVFQGLGGISLTLPVRFRRLSGDFRLVMIFVTAAPT